MYKEERVERKGAATSVVRKRNKKHERNPITQEQKRRPVNIKKWKKGDGCIGHHARCAHCIGIKDRR